MYNMFSSAVNKICGLRITEYLKGNVKMSVQWAQCELLMKIQCVKGGH